MNRKSKAKKTVGFLMVIGIVLVVLASLVLGGYFVLDKAVVPSYFGKYGIHNLGDLVEMVKLMHNAPDEKTFITHPYTSSHETTVVTKLEEAGVPVVNGKIDFKKIVDGKFTITEEAKQGMFVSDFGVAAVLGQMLESGYLVSYLDELSYFDTLSFSAKEVKITPKGEMEEAESGNLFSNMASVSLTVKLDTGNAQKHMAKVMDVPLFLLNMIIPKSLYITSEYDVAITEKGEYVVSNASLGINGRTPEQSEILLNMLITFLFPAEDEMNVEKLSHKFGDVLNTGLQILGDVKFCTQTTASGTQSGIFVSIDPHIESNEPETPPEAE